MSRPCCDEIRQISEQFTIASRLHYEAVVSWAKNYGDHAKHAQLRDVAKKAQERAEEMALRFEEHVQRHRRMTSRAIGGDA